MSRAVAEHRGSAPLEVRIAVLTVSDTRTIETDTSGASILELASRAGHLVVDRQIMPDNPRQIAAHISQIVSARDIDAILITGGTGIAPRDQTPEAVVAMLTKRLPGFGELFRSLSYSEIGAAAMLTRAEAGVVDDVLVFLMPGSRAAVTLAMERLILPELAHAVGLVRPERRRHS